MPLSAPLAFIIGAVLGSFLNVIILRNKLVAVGVSASLASPRVALGRSGDKGGLGGILRGRSACLHCHKTLTWYELIPLISFTLQRGRCRACLNQLSPQYSLVELAMGVSTLILFTPLPASAIATASAVLSTISIALLITLFVIDLRTLILPDIFVITLAVVVASTLLLNYGLRITDYGLLNALWGAALGTGALALLWLITRGRGLGLGDVKLMLPLGALFGSTITVVLLFLAFVAGGIIGLFLLVTGRATMKTPVPFGPFLTGVAILFILVPGLPLAILHAIIG